MEDAGPPTIGDEEWQRLHGAPPLVGSEFTPLVDSPLEEPTFFVFVELGGGSLNLSQPGTVGKVILIISTQLWTLPKG